MPADLTPIFAFATKAALRSMPIEETVGGMCERVVEAGIALDRMHLSTALLHPMVSSIMVDWNEAEGARRSDVGHGLPEHMAWLQSPLRHMLVHDIRQMRRRLDRPNFTPEDEAAIQAEAQARLQPRDPVREALARGITELRRGGTDAMPDFPVLREFADEGYTDWLALSEGFEWRSSIVPGGQYGIITSWATRRRGGFDEDELRTLRMVTRALAVAVKTSFMDDIAHDVLGAYLGADAAARVLSGAITRGGVTQLPAAIMMADIKGFTRFSNTRPIADVVALLNDSFDALAGAVDDHGGHILKFVGDGALAIFLLEGREASEVAARALGAALAIQASLPEGVGVDIGLNIGDVHYGNVGAAGRLDFTAIGPAVNEAARLEALCAQLGHRILLSGAMAEALPADWRGRLVGLGNHPMRGWDDPRPVFAPA